MQDISLRQIGQYILIVVTAWLGMRAVVLLPYLASASNPWHLPYAETFDYLDRLHYQHINGNWEVQQGALVQTVFTDTDVMAVIPIEIQPGNTYRFQSHLEFRSGRHSGGLLFNLQHTSHHQQSHVLRFSAENNLNTLTYGYFDEQANFVSQGFTAETAQSSQASGVDLAVQVAETSYDILVNGNLIASDIPLKYSGGMLALTTWFSQVAFDNIIVESLAENEEEPHFIATPVPASQVITAAFADSFDNPASHSQWLPFHGDWTFESGALTQARLNPGNYVSYASPYAQFILRVQFSHRQGAGAGVLFNMPQTDAIHGAQFVGYHDENTLVWGYFDDRGAFQEQGSMRVSAPETALHVLEVATNGSTYGIMLDGRPVIVGVSLHSTHGFVGLSAANSIVTFEQVELFTTAL